MEGQVAIPEIGEFSNMCATHDWNYVDNDNMIQWDRDNETDKKLGKIATHSPEYMRVFFQFRDKNKNK